VSAVIVQPEVKETPIIFNGPVVRAILEGRKTQTRRVIKPQPASDMKLAHEDGGGNWIFWSGPIAQDMAAFTKKAYPNGEGIKCPYGKPGDRLWVREALRWTNYLVYDADREPVDPDLIPAGIRIGRDYLPMTHMPRWASRITLEIKSIRVERLQDISEAGAIAEGMRKHDASGVWSTGVNPLCYPTARDAFAAGWDTINTKRGYSWEANPWIWLIEFKKL
jgi:hypothetical protein